MNKQQLANKIWASANKMRSKIDANEYKDYILGLIFYKFLSDNEVNYILKDMKRASDQEKQTVLESLVENYEDENSKVIIDYCKHRVQEPLLHMAAAQQHLYRCRYVGGAELFRPSDQSQLQGRV